jgi:cytosine/adenosine deaminase-related metal-dependent hydrolase
MPAVNVVEMATRGGARALHLEDRVGSLEPGKLADLIVIDTSGTHLTPLYDVYSALVYAANPRDVRTTIIHGRMRHGGPAAPHGRRRRGQAPACARSPGRSTDSVAAGIK